MVAVTVMDGEKMGATLVELAGASGADEAVHFQGFPAIAGVVIELGPHAAELCLDLSLCGEFDAGGSARFHQVYFTTGIFSFSDASLRVPWLIAFS